jgi:thymidylate kinase
VTRLEFGPYQELSLPAASQVLERRNFDGKVAAPDQDDELWLLLLHCTIDKGSFRGARAARVQELARHGTAAGPLRDFVEELCPQGWGTERLLAAAAAGRWVELEQAGSVIRASWERRGPLKAATGSLTARSLRLATRALLVPRRGITVALLAPDGAGKSTLAEGLRSTFFFPVRIVYMGTFDQRAGRSGLLTLGPHLMRQWLRYGRARAHKARGRLVIFDRYTFDKLLPPPRPPDLPRRIRRWALAHSCPLPDLVVVLDVPSEEMFRRKGEHDVSHLEKRRRGYLELSKRVARMHVVDATREPDIVRRDVTALIWRVLAKRLTHRRRLSDQAAS